MRNFKIVPTTWLSDNEFVGTATKTLKYRDGRIEEVVRACYGWTREDRSGVSFSVYLVEKGQIEKLGTLKRDQLLDFRSVKV